MTANQAQYSIQMMSRTLGVSRSGFYAYHSRPPSARSLADEALSKRIAAIHKASKETYRAPHIHAELADEDIFVGRKRIERLMQAKGLRGVSRRKFVVTTERDPRVRSAADPVDRNFYADAPNVLWVADITFVPTWAGFLYLAVVLDAFSRRIVGWAMGTDLPPKAPSFITRVCGSGFHFRRLWFGQARRARSPQIAQASGAPRAAFGCRAMRGA